MANISLTKITSENMDAFRSLFIGRPMSQDLSVGAIVNDTAVGVATYTTDNVMMTLRYIFVAPEYRRQGVASLLINHIGLNMAEAGVHGLYAVCSPSEEDVLELLRSTGFEVSVSKRVQTLPISVIAGSATLKKNKPKIMANPANRRVIPMTKADAILPSSSKKAFSNRLTEVSISGDMLLSGDYDPELSYVVYEDRSIKSLVLSSTFEGSTDVVVTLFASFSENPAEPVVLLYNFFNGCVGKYGGEGVITFVPVDVDMRDKLCKLIGEVPEELEALQAIKILN